MTAEEFIFNPGTWLGEGKISLSLSPEQIKFYTKWQIVSLGEKGFSAKQIVEIEGIKERTINTFTFFDIQETSFKVILENEFVERLEGIGVREKHAFKWQFFNERQTGFESYVIQENGEFVLHAEYGSEEDYRTFIDGLLWRKSE